MRFCGAIYRSMWGVPSCGDAHVTLDIEAKRSERAQDDTPLPVKELELGSPEKREKA